jgi:hypothetical protein
MSKNSARRGPNLYNHGGNSEVFCRYIAKTYNRPKVNGHISQVKDHHHTHNRSIH